MDWKRLIELVDEDGLQVLINQHLDSEEFSELELTKEIRFGLVSALADFPSDYRTKFLDLVVNGEKSRCVVQLAVAEYLRLEIWRIFTAFPLDSPDGDSDGWYSCKAHWLTQIQKAAYWITWVCKELDESKPINNDHKLVLNNCIQTVAHFDWSAQRNFVEPDPQRPQSPPVVILSKSADTPKEKKRTHPFVSTPNGGKCSSCGESRRNSIHDAPEQGW